MKCNLCGTPIEGDPKFCPNCGAPVELQSDADTVINPLPDVPISSGDTAPEEPTPQPDPIPEPESIPQPNPVPQQNPYANPGSTPYGGTVNAIPNGVPNDPTMSAVPPMGQPPKKKKKKVWLIVLLILIPVVLIVVVLACVFGMAFSYQNRGTESVDAYWEAYVNGSSEEIAAMVPEDFWTYATDTYGFTKEEMISGMDEYLTSVEEDLGENLSYEWSQNNFTVASGTSLDDVNDELAEFGLKASIGIGVDISARVTGADTYDDHNFAMWTVKIDGDWYNHTAMLDFIDMCEEGYAEQAKYKAEFGDITDAYETALYQADGAAIGTMVPAQFWDYLAEGFDCTQSEAEGYLTQYLTDLITDSYAPVDEVTMEYTIVQIDDCEEDDMADLNEGLEEYGLAGEEMKDIYVDEVISYNGTEEDNSTYMTVTKIDGEWYVYDVMYYFTQACYYYGYDTIDS